MLPQLSHLPSPQQIHLQPVHWSLEHLTLHLHHRSQLLGNVLLLPQLRSSDPLILRILIGLIHPVLPPLPPKTKLGKPTHSTGTIPKTTRSSTKAAGIELPTPAYQKETIEATLRKARKAEAERTSTSGGSTQSRPSTSGTRPKTTQATQAAFRAEEAKHLANLARIKQRASKK